MAKVTNLRQFKKQKTRIEKAKHGDVNAAKFGESKAIKERLSREKARETLLLDGKKLDIPVTKND